MNDVSLLVMGTPCWVIMMCLLDIKNRVMLFALWDNCGCWDNHRQQHPLFIKLRLSITRNESLNVHIIQILLIELLYHSFFLIPFYYLPTLKPRKVVESFRLNQYFT